MRGTFIVIDGGDGTGTTSMTAYLASVFGDCAIRTREPGGSPLAEKIRAVILDPLAKHADSRVMVGLFAAARLDHVLNVIRPALDKGLHVFCDRFDSSTYAYQVRGAKRHDLAHEVHGQREWLLDLRAMPDHYIILDGDPRVCLMRAKKRAEKAGEVPNHFDEQTFEYHDAVRKGFKDFVMTRPHTIVNAEEPEDIVRAKVLAVVQKVIAQW
ncbi:dTMP kinase [Candidatus Kaiserbacteria bacterium]|nr:dTMP kinase [Candidatus Kaiserbacteria bacterium]